MTYTVYGSLGSPYSMKVRAALRARRLPNIWVQLEASKRNEIMSNVKVPVIPVIKRPDGSFTNDSTPFLLELEKEHSERSLLPNDPLQRFVCLMLEDMADEWATKAMFHYRWFRDVDADQMSKWLIFDNMPGAGREAIEMVAAGIRERQVSRMPIVGCTPQNAPIIERSADEMMAALAETGLTGPFLFGTRPSLADVSLYGQLSQLAVDPTPQERMREHHPYCYRWLMFVDDASGFEGEWCADALKRPGLQKLIKLTSEVYLPFLAANEEALKRGEANFSLHLYGRPYSQSVFKYQSKCLNDMRGRYAALDEDTRRMMDDLLGDGAAILRA